MFLPWQFFAEVDELPIGAVLIDERKVDACPGSVSNLHLSVLRTEFCLDPSRVSRVDLDVGTCNSAARCTVNWFSAVFDAL